VRKGCGEDYKSELWGQKREERQAMIFEGVEGERAKTDIGQRER
jgi:hypothetical protein